MAEAALSATLAELKGQEVPQEAKAAHEADVAALEAKLAALRSGGDDGGGQQLTAAQRVFGTVLQEYILLAEMKLAGQFAKQGVYVRGHPATTYAWDGVIFVRGGQFYEGGIFKFRLLIPQGYPDEEVPRLFFQSSVFHPRVNDLTGEIGLSHLYASWDPARDRLWHLLRYVRHMFHHIDATNPVNEGAASLYNVDKDMFRSAVQRCVQSSDRHVYAETANVVRFEQPNTKHESARKEMKDWEQSKANSFKVASGARFLRSNPSQECKTRAAVAVAAGNVEPGGRIHAPVSLRENAILILGPSVGTAPDIRIGDEVCEGYVSLRESTNTTLERRYLVLDVEAGTLSAFETEKQQHLVEQLQLREIHRTYQPMDAESKSSNSFVVVTSERTFYMHGPSEKAMFVWIRALLHAVTLVA